MSTHLVALQELLDAWDVDSFLVAHEQSSKAVSR
jgi:hypothetical protein